MESQILGFFIHVFTASGAALGLIALFCAVEGRFAAMFGWLGVALIVDAVDGTLARRFRVAQTVPQIDGAALDLVVDFLTYVVTPLVAIWRAGALPSLFAGPACGLVCAASALYFADRGMKTPDLWFSGFPALWNVVALYLLVFRPDPLLALVAVAGMAALMFAPIVFVHPLRVKRLRRMTLAMTALWGAAAILAVSQELAASPLTKTSLIVTACYFVILPLFREKGAVARGGFDG